MMIIPRLLTLIFLTCFAGVSTTQAEVFPRHSNAAIQDEARILSAGTTGTLRELAEQDGRFIRVVIISDRHRYGSTGSFSDYVDELAISWHVPMRPNAILVVHETASNQVTVRLGAGYSEQDLETANVIVQRRYLPAVRAGHYQSAHMSGLLDLLFAIHGKPPSPTQAIVPLPAPEPVIVNTLKDTGQVIQDHVGVLAPLSVAPLRAEMESYRSKGIFIRLVVIQRYSDFGDAKMLGQFGKSLFRHWGMSDVPGSVLVLHNAQNNKIYLRISNSFDMQAQHNAQEALSRIYKPLLAKHKFSQAHNQGIRAILQGLDETAAQSGQTGQTSGIIFFDHEHLIQDVANVLSPKTIAEMETMWRAETVPPIHILTVPDRLVRQSGSNFTVFAHALFQSWGMLDDPGNILLVHNTDTQKIRLVFGRNYTLADQHHIRRAVKTAALPALQQYDNNRAQILGLRALLDTLVNKLPPPPAHIAIQNTGRALYDLAGVLSQSDTRELQQLFKTQKMYGQTVRLVILDDFHPLTTEKTLLSFVAALFLEWGLDQDPYAVLVVQDISRNRIILRLGTAYDKASKFRAREVLYITGRGSYLSGSAPATHLQRMKTMLAELPDPYAPKPLAKVDPKPHTQQDGNEEPQSSPFILGLLALTIAVVAGGTFWNYRKISTPRRERAARITAFKRQRQDKP